MNRVRLANPNLLGLEPYNPQNLPAEVFISANENPANVPPAVAQEIARRLKGFPFNRYPDATANRLRSLIAEANGLDVDNVLVGNGGDELLFNLFLTWGGQGRGMLNLPPTFSAYALDAYLTGTRVVEVPRRSDFTVDEVSVIERLQQADDIDLVIITSPNNPTGDVASSSFIERVLDATDALVLVDEAYWEFSYQTARPLMTTHRNLIILRTFSKAFSLAGARVGYVLADPFVISTFLKVRQPYSVDAVSQTIAEVVFENRSAFEPGIRAIVAQRARLLDDLASVPGIQVFPSEANYILVRLPDAHRVWERLYEEYSVLVRDFSATPGLEDCLRVTVGSKEENDRCIAALSAIQGEGHHE